MKSIGKAIATKRECLAEKTIYVLMPELQLRKISPQVIFLMNGCLSRNFKLINYCTDIFQRNMLDRYLDWPNKKFKLGQCQIIDQVCFT